VTATHASIKTDVSGLLAGISIPALDLVLPATAAPNPPNQCQQICKIRSPGYEPVPALLMDICKHSESNVLTCHYFRIKSSLRTGLRYCQVGIRQDRVDFTT
jgi:hypothetical protein